MKSYRPVSNLPILSKIIEGVVAKRLLSHIHQNNLFDENQSAYRQYHSTETALLKLQDDILQKLDHDKVVALLMIDVSAAFDTVPHERLINCFENEFGLKNTALNWIRSYLNDRYQKVIVQNSHSKTTKMECGFPQGAKLAGLKYNVYTAPLSKVVKQHPVNHKSYADDNELYISFSAINEDFAITQLQNCVNDVKSWMRTNYLKMNDDKTKVIFFTPRKGQNIIREILVGDDIIKPSNKVKNLGIMLDKNLNMESQINYVTKSVYFHLRNISKIRHYLNCENTKSLVQSLVITRLDYCNGILANLPKRLISKLQKAQNCAARLIRKTRKRAHITPVLKDLHWLPVEHRIKYKIILLTFKCLNSQAPQYLRNLITLYSPPRLLRSNNRLTGSLVYRHYQRRKHGGRTFSAVAPQYWNSLPQEIRNAETLQKFKSLLKTHLFRQVYET